MNPYQKLGAFLARVVGCLAVLIGGIPPLHYGASRMAGISAFEQALDRFLGDAIWAAAGVLLIIFSRGIGRMLGRGLE